jgi:hypothetical protein
MSTPSRPARPVAVLQPAEQRAGVELHQLWRYGAVAALVAASALVSAWSRVDLVGTSVALDGAQARLDRAQAERERLELELATVTDPAHLLPAATTLSLAGGVRVIDLPAAN